MTEEWVLTDEDGNVVGHGSKMAMVSEAVIFARLKKRRWAMPREYYNLACDGYGPTC